MGQAAQSSLICCAQEGCAGGRSLLGDGDTKGSIGPEVCEIIGEGGRKGYVGTSTGQDKATRPLVAPVGAASASSPSAEGAQTDPADDLTPRDVSRSEAPANSEENAGAFALAYGGSEESPPTVPQTERVVDKLKSNASAGSAKSIGKKASGSSSNNQSPQKPPTCCGLFCQTTPQATASSAGPGTQRRNSGSGQSTHSPAGKRASGRRSSGTWNIGMMGKGPQCPLILHFDVNKTIIHSDSINAKNVEDGVREAVADLFWGRVNTSKEGNPSWSWVTSSPSVTPPNWNAEGGTGNMVTYFKFCKNVLKNDKDGFKTAVRKFNLVKDRNTVTEMEHVVNLALSKLALPKDVLADATKVAQLREVGLRGDMYFIVPTLFHLVANLQKSGRKFAILFRSFGNDHAHIMDEWNAFCEMRHPVFSRLLKDIGPLNGSVPNVPDRRVQRIHTLYRDVDGPVLIMDTFTNGPTDQTWDAWVKAKPKPKVDTRDGRTFVREVLKAKTIDGLDGLQKWTESQLTAQGTCAIKDDWAWWQFHGERATAGKLMPLLAGHGSPRQVFFDDNIDLDDPRIVDCRDPEGQTLPAPICFRENLCVKVNPVEALLSNDYFLSKLQRPLLR